MTWQEFWDSVVKFFADNIWNIVLFAAVAIFGLVAIKIILVIVRKIFKKSKADPTLGHFVTAILKFALLMVYIITLLSLIGIPITSLVAVMTALSLAVALAVQDCFSSLAYGVIMIAGKMFKEGEFVDIEGTSGTVERVSMLNTVLMTADGQKVTVPHSKTAKAVIVNYTREGKRRMDIPVSVAYGSDVDKVKSVLSEIYESDDRVLKEEANCVVLTQYAASSVDFSFRAWTKVDDYWAVRFDFNERILKVLNENGIEIPYQTIDVNIKDAAAVSGEPNAKSK